MTHSFPKLLFLILGMLLLLSLSACELRSPEELYMVPEQPDSYYNLQEAISDALGPEIDYCAPAGGENRQPIQLRDLDGDGKDEAILFAKSAGEEPLKVYIFSRDAKDSFQLLSEIPGVGSSFDQVTYGQLDGSPGLELIVGRKIANQVLCSCSVYSLQSSLSLELANSKYSSMLLSDLDDDGREDLFLYKADGENGAASVELLRYSEGALRKDAELSVTGTGSLVQLVSGNLNEEKAAVFLTVRSDSGIVSTDVYAVAENAFVNLVKTPDASEVLIQQDPVYPKDLDGDGIMELPDVMTLPSEKGDLHRLIDWYSLSADGSRKSKLLTYHDFSHGFYLDLSDCRNGVLSIESEMVPHGSGITFQLLKENASEAIRLCTLYLFTEEDAFERASSEGRFLLKEKNGISFSALPGDPDGGMTEEILKDKFHEIQTVLN